MFDSNLREQQPLPPKRPILEGLKSLAQESNVVIGSLLYPLSGEGVVERRQVAHDIRAQAERARNIAEVDLEAFRGTRRYPKDADEARIAAAEALRLNQEANQRLYAQQMNSRTARVERRVRPQTALPQLGRPMTDEQMAARVATDREAVDRDRGDHTGDQDQLRGRRELERVQSQYNGKRQDAAILPKLSFGSESRPNAQLNSDYELSDEDFSFYTDLLAETTPLEVMKSGHMTKEDYQRYQRDKRKRE